MSEKIGPVYYNEREGYVSPQKQAEIDAEIRRYVPVSTASFVAWLPRGALAAYLAQHSNDTDLLLSSPGYWLLASSELSLC